MHRIHTALPLYIFNTPILMVAIEILMPLLAKPIRYAHINKLHEIQLLNQYIYIKPKQLTQYTNCVKIQKLQGRN